MISIVKTTHFDLNEHAYLGSFCRQVFGTAGLVNSTSGYPFMQYLFLYPNNLKIPALTLLHLKKVHFWVFLQPFQSYYMYKELKVLTWTKC